MTQTKRYYPRFAGKDGFEERYEVIDSVSREAVGGRVSYHDANESARKLNDEPEAQGEWAVALKGAITVPLVDAETIAGFEEEWTRLSREPLKFLPYTPHKIEPVMDSARAAILKKLVDQALAALAHAEEHGEAEMSGVRIKAISDGFHWTWADPK